MTDKTTTLTTQTGDSIYPNVLDENIPDTIARVSDVNKIKTDVEANYLTNANAEATYQTQAGRADYVSKTYGDGTYATITQLGGKQDKLTAGTHITIEGTTIAATLPENMALYGDLAATDGEFTGGGSGGGGGGSSIPVVEGTFSETTDEGAYATFTIPETQHNCFIFKCDLGTAFISYNDVFGTYNGYLDANGDIAGDNIKLSQLIVLSGSGTKINVFFGQLGSDGGGGNIVTIEVTSMPDTQTTIDVSAITNDTQFVNIKETSTNKNYLLYRVGDDFASCFSNELTQGKIVAYYYISTQQKQLYYFISSVGKIGKIFGNHDIQVPAVSSNNILPCTTADNGKVLSVVNGEAQWAKGFEYDTITIDEKGESYTGTITGGKPVYDTTSHGFLQGVAGTLGVSTGVGIESSEHGSNDIYSLVQNLYSQNRVSHRVYYIQPRTYSHFITLTNSTSTFFITYQNISESKIITHDSLKKALAGKSLICTGHTDTKKAEYIYGEGGNIVVGVVDNSDNSTSSITIDSSFTITDLVSPIANHLL